MNDFVMLKIDLYCDQVKKGKPCACLAIQDRYAEEAVKRIEESFELRAYTEELSHGWKTVWIYKDKYMIEVIKLLPEEPKTVFDHWVLGKAFGYSDEAIRTFLKTKV